MKCPKCGSEQTKVSNTRNYADRTMIRRQRTCKGCLHIWYTLEVPEKAVIGITKPGAMIEMR